VTTVEGEYGGGGLGQLAGDEEGSGSEQWEDGVEEEVAGRVSEKRSWEVGGLSQ
jgi:hypothetical protein